MFGENNERKFESNEATPGEMVKTNSYTHLVYGIINTVIIGIGMIFLVPINILFLWMIPAVVVSIIGLVIWIIIKKTYFSLLIAIFSYIIVACVFLTILALLDDWGTWVVIGISLFEISLICRNYYDSHPGTVIFND